VTDHGRGSAKRSVSTGTPSERCRARQTPPGLQNLALRNPVFWSIATGTPITVAWDQASGNLPATVSVYSPYTCGCYTDTPSNSTSYTFYNLIPGTWYCFIAYAWNNGGNSGLSQWACSYP